MCALSLAICITPLYLLSMSFANWVLTGSNQSNACHKYEENTPNKKMEVNGVVVKDNTGKYMKNVTYMKSQELCKWINMNRVGTVVDIHVGERRKQGEEL